MPLGAFTVPDGSSAVAGVAPATSAGTSGGIDAATSVVVERSQFGQVYRNEDGSTTTGVAGVPLNVETSPGHWAPVSTSVSSTADGGGLVSVHPLSPTFAASADDPSLLTVRQAGVQVHFSLVGASRRDLVRSGASATYPQVFSRTDLRYDVMAGSVKESLVLSSAPWLPRSYTWRITGDGFDVRQGRDGSLEIARLGRLRAV